MGGETVGVGPQATDNLGREEEWETGRIGRGGDGGRWKIGRQGKSGRVEDSEKVENWETKKA